MDQGAPSCERAMYVPNASPIGARLPPRVSAVLIVLNEEADLAQCLASVREIVDEIVVLDGGSQDTTVEIAKRLGARVATRPFDDFGRQKQAALELATGEWIFSIDADERVSPELAREITRVVSQPDAADGYWIRRSLIYLGRRLRFGGVGSEWVLRLARRNRARFAPLAVHEHLIVEGRTGRLRGTLEHIQARELRELIQRLNLYTDLAAARRRQMGRRFSMLHFLRLEWEMAWRLFFRLGILDGPAGVIHAVMAGFYAFTQYAKLWREPE